MCDSCIDEVSTVVVRVNVPDGILTAFEPRYITMSIDGHAHVVRHSIVEVVFQEKSYGILYAILDHACIVRGAGYNKTTPCHRGRCALPLPVIESSGVCKHKPPAPSKISHVSTKKKPASLGNLRSRHYLSLRAATIADGLSQQHCHVSSTTC